MYEYVSKIRLIAPVSQRQNFNTGNSEKIKSIFQEAIKMFIGTCNKLRILHQDISNISGFGGLVVSMLASGTQDRGFDPERSRRIFRAKKSTACLP